MASFVQILTVESFDLTPCLVFSSENKRILFNIGEGIQRLCVEHKIKLGKLDSIFITDLDPKQLCGLPGLCLTYRDVKPGSSLSLFGPKGLKEFIQSTNYFIRTENLQTHVHENSQTSEEAFKIDDFQIIQIPFFQTRHLYIIQTPIIPGKFDVKKAKDLGVPTGPLFGKLKSGFEITLDDGRLIHPDQVLGPSQPGGRCLIVPPLPLPLPLEGLSSGLNLSLPFDSSLRSRPFDCIIHLSSSDVLLSPLYQSWAQSLPLSSVPVPCSQHLGLGLNACHPLCPSSASSLLTAKLRSLSPILFPALALQQQPEGEGKKECEDEWWEPAAPHMRFSLSPPNNRGLVPAPPPTIQTKLEEFLQRVQSSPPTQSLLTRVSEERAKCDPFPQDPLLAPHSLLFLGTGSAVPSKYRNVSSLLLDLGSEAGGLGEGRGGSILMDVGEGTLHQLSRLTQVIEGSPPSLSTLLARIQLVWISHPHADHHLGLVRVLLERKARHPHPSPTLLIAPSSVLAFLRDLSPLFPSLSSSYVALNCRVLDPLDPLSRPDCFLSESDLPSLLSDRAFLLPSRIHASTSLSPPSKEAEFARTVWQRLGLGEEGVVNVRAEHCPQAFSLVLSLQSDWKFVYSGDSRPCERLEVEGRGALVLVHEATFEDGMEEDALSKRHCTVSEALGVGRRMGAGHTVLTHFSQRYPTSLPLSHDSSPSALCAFDFLRVPLSGLTWAPHLSPLFSTALALDDEEEEEEGREGEVAVDRIEKQKRTMKGAALDSSGHGKRRKEGLAPLLCRVVGGHGQGFGCDCC